MGDAIGGDGCELRVARNAARRHWLRGDGTAIIRLKKVAVTGVPEPDRMPMQVEASVFLGDRWEYRLTRGSLRLVAHGPGPLEQGEVWCELPPRDVWIFPQAQIVETDEVLAAVQAGNG